MKKTFFCLLLGIFTSICNANEYTSLCEERTDLEQKISSLEEKMRSKLRWLTDSIRKNLNLKKELVTSRQRLEEVKRKISYIEENTSVYITRVELQGIPDFDENKLGNGNCDLRIYFRKEGVKNSFISMNKCGANADFSVYEKLDVNDVLEIKDQDGIMIKDWEDMGQISCRDIFLDALKNESASGCFSRSIRTIVKDAKGNPKSYQISITYSRQ